MKSQESPESFERFKEVESSLKSSRNPIRNMFIQGVQENGIYVLVSPTGSGKSYELSSFISLVQNDPKFRIKHFGDRIPDFVIVSPLISNIDALESDFKTKGVEYYRAKSIFDHLSKVFSAPDGSTLKSIEQCREIIPVGEVLDSLEFKELFTTFRIVKDMQANGITLGDELSSKYRVFKARVFKYLQSGSSDKYSRLPEKERLKALYVRCTKKDSWINSIFPDTIPFLQEAIKEHKANDVQESSQVFLMTSKKLFGSSIYSPLGKLFSDSFISFFDSCNDIVFILDEADSIKHDIRNIIIERGLRGSGIDLLKLAHELIYTLMGINLDPNDSYIWSAFAEMDARRSRNGNRDKNRVSYTGVLRNAQEMAVKLNEQYLSSLDYATRLAPDLENQLSDGNHKNIFLYQSGTISWISGLDSKSSRLYLLKHGTVRYLSNSPDVISESENDAFVKTVKLGEIRKFIRDIMRFANFVEAYILEPYADYKVNNAREQFDEELSRENAFINVLHDFQFSETTIRFFLSSIRAQGVSKTEAERKQHSSAFYDKGFITSQVESEHERNAELNTYFAKQTPEEILLMLADKHPIILVSATAGSLSIRNFNLQYLQENLESKGLQYYLPQEELKSLESYLQYNDLKENVDYHVDIESGNFEAANELQEQCDKLFIVDKNHAVNIAKAYGEKLYQMLLRYRKGDNLFYAFRYLEFAMMYKDVRLKGSNAIIAFSPRNLRGLEEVKDPVYGGSPEDVDLHQYAQADLQNILGLIDTYFFKDKIRIIPFAASYKSENEADDDAIKKTESRFHSMIKDCSEIYEQNNPVMIVTSYATAGTGLNFKISARADDQLVPYNPHGQLINDDKKEKSFNGLILMTPTNVQAVPIRKDTEDKEALKARMNRVYDINELTEVGAINNQGREYLFKNDEKTDKKSVFYQYEVARIVKQACGRLMRGKWKDTFCNIALDQQIIDCLQTDYNDGLGETPVVKAIYSAIPDFASKSIAAKRTAENDRLLALMEKSNQVQSIYLENIVNHLRPTATDQDTRRVEYIRIGEGILKYGICLDRVTYNSLPEELKACYSRVPLGKTCLYYELPYGDEYISDYQNVRIYYDNDDKNQRIRESNKAALLGYYEAIPWLRWYFEKDRICFDHGENIEYMLLPVYYNNIYKGRLSEYVTKAAFKQFFSIDLQDIKDPNVFEFADFVYEHCAIDVKQYSINTAKRINITELYKRSAEKTAKLGCNTCVFIQPILQGGISHGATSGQKYVETEDGKKIRMVEVRGLMGLVPGKDHCQLNNEAAEVIGRVFHEE